MQIKSLSNERWLLKRRTAHSVIIWPLSWLQRPSRAPPLYNHFCALFWKPLTNLISHSADKLSLYFLHSDYPTPSPLSSQILTKARLCFSALPILPSLPILPQLHWPFLVIPLNLQLKKPLMLWLTILLPPSASAPSISKAHRPRWWRERQDA